MIEANSAESRQRSTSKLMHMIGVPLVIYLGFYLFAFLQAPSTEKPLSQGITGTISALLSIISFYVYWNEVERGSGPVFFNFFVFFGFNAIQRPFRLLFLNPFLRLDPYAGVYDAEFGIALYCFFLTFSLTFLLVQSVWTSLGLLRKYLLTFVLVGTFSVCLFHPYILNPRYLYTTKDVQDYKSITVATQGLSKVGRDNVGAQELASLVRLYDSGNAGAAHELDRSEKARRITELLPYLEGDNYYPLVYKPMYRDVLFMSLASIGVIVLFLGFNFVRNPPTAAYLEKIVLLFLPYTLIDALHSFVFSTIQSKARSFALYSLGQYCSVAVMLLLVIVFLYRLRFILSAEGRFYEHHLMLNSERITRWRDAFDNWILKKFMNPGDLDRRFLIRRKDKNR